MLCYSVHCSIIQCSAVQCSAVQWRNVYFSAVQCSAVQCRAVQCSAVQCSAVQCSAVQCSAVQCSAVQCSAVQWSAAQCSAVQCSAVQCSSVQCSAVQCSAVQCSAVQCSAVQCGSVWCSALHCSEIQWSLYNVLQLTAVSIKCWMNPHPRICLGRFSLNSYSILYTLHCTLYTVHYTLYTIHCTLYIVHCTLYTLKYSTYKICVLFLTVVVFSSMKSNMFMLLPLTTKTQPSCPPEAVVFWIVSGQGKHLDTSGEVVSYFSRHHLAEVVLPAVLLSNHPLALGLALHLLGPQRHTQNIDVYWEFGSLYVYTVYCTL